MRMSTKRVLAMVTIVTLAAPAVVRAAVITDPAVVSGGPGQNPIDPTGFESVNLDATGTGFTTQSDLESRSDLRVLQSFAEFTVSNQTPNFVDFTTDDFPDIRFTTSGSQNSGPTGTGSADNADRVKASEGAAFRLLLGSGSGTLTTTIDFGTFNGGTSFTSTGNAVDAVGFVVTSVRAGSTITATFFDDSLAPVQLAQFTQTGSDTDTGELQGREIFFGFDAPGATSIGSIVLTRTATSNGATAAGLDDFAFTVNVIPEPTTAAAVAGLGGLLALRRRRAVG